MGLHKEACAVAVALLECNAPRPVRCATNAVPLSPHAFLLMEDQYHAGGISVTVTRHFSLGSASAAIVVLVAAFVMTLATDSARSETTIGRWCDRMIPNLPEYNRTIAIDIADDGKVLLTSNFRDGSSSVNELRETSGGIYEVIESSSGDKYRLVPSSGDLQLLDNDGLIRIASRLENTPQDNECST